MKEELLEEFFSSMDEEELYCGFCVKSGLLCSIVAKYEEDFDPDLWTIDPDRELIVYRCTDDGYLGISNMVRDFITDTLIGYIESASYDCADEIYEKRDGISESITVILAIENDLINGSNGDHLSNYMDELKDEYETNVDKEEYESFESYYDSLSFMWRFKTWYYDKTDDIDDLVIKIFPE